MINGGFFWYTDHILKAMDNRRTLFKLNPFAPDTMSPYIILSGKRFKSIPQS